jgi:ABC-type glycerol-3-phosphate transport system substrate-binding protein
MNIYGKITNDGKLQRVTTSIYVNGKQIFWNQTNELQKAGFKPIVNDTFPENVGEFEKVEDGLREDSNAIVITYTVVPMTAQEKIYVLETKQTPRLLREAAFGEDFAINKLKTLDGQIAELRKEL